jgi:hypothetical protein
VLLHFTRLLVHPPSAIQRIIHEQPDLTRIVLFVFVVSILRGIVEGIWVLLRVGQLGQVATSWTLFHSYLRLGIPFLISSLTCGYVRWIGFALAAYWLGRFFGGKQGRFNDWLRLTGIFMGLYLVAILPNFAYLIWTLPMIQFRISSLYNPGLGVGQMLTSVWLGLLLYQAVRIVHGLARFQSLLIGASIVLANIGALVLGSLIFFNLPRLDALPFRGTMHLATWVFIVITVLTVPLFLRWGYRLDRRRTLTTTLRGA